MPDDHSEVVPLLPIPNRTVKRLCADDSAGSRVKVGHRQAITARNAQSSGLGVFFSAYSPSFKENVKRLQQALKKHARIQGFADHSESSKAR